MHKLHQASVMETLPTHEKAYAYYFIKLKECTHSSLWDPALLVIDTS